MKSKNTIFVILTLCLPIYSESGSVEYFLKRPNSTANVIDACDVVNVTMTCKEIPSTVPKVVKNVIILDHRGSYNDAFLGLGWKHVTSLYIAGTTGALDNSQLKGLESVENLVLSFPSFIAFSPKVFVDTPNIQRLSLLEMGYLNMDNLMTYITQPRVLNKLTDLTFNPGVRSNPPRVYFSNSVMKGLFTKPLVKVCLSRTVIQYDMEAVVKLALKVDVLNVSGSYLVNTYKPPLIFLRKNDSAPLLKVLDASDSTLPYILQSQFFNHSKLSSGFFKYTLAKIEHVYANHIYRKDVNITDCFNDSVSKIFWKSIYLRRNNIQFINCTNNLNEDSAFELADFSENKIHYISSKFISTAINLKTLYLSDNMLFYMERMPEFEVLFATLKHLSTLYLGVNGLTYIPWNMFSNNHNLKILNLAGNKLSTVAFNLVNLTNLQTLDLTANLIHYIEGDALARLSVFIDVARQKKRNRFEILLQDNPFLCSCKSAEFIQWLLAEVHDETEASSYNCKYIDSSIAIDKKAIYKSKFLCKRTVIIVFSSLGLGITTVLVCVTIYYVWATKAKRRIRRIANDFKQAYNDGHLKEKCICFLAYAGREEELVHKVLLTPLNNVLIEKLNNNKRPISTGYDFKPGFPIYDEAYRCVQDSCVFIAVVSEAFCQSDYCKGEIREAYTQQKPIIVILLGTVTEKNMSPYLLEVFRRNARAKIVEQDDGDVEIVPDLDAIAESVLSLAAGAFNI